MSFCAAAQNDATVIDKTTITTDTAPTKKQGNKKGKKKKDKKEKQGLFKKIADKTYPNPTRAAFLSLALPGTGQLYNKKYWKMPIIYTGLGGLTWLAIDRQQEYKRMKTLYEFKVRGEENTFDNTDISLVSAGTLLSLRNQVNSERQRAYIGIFLLWVLNATDAFVDAHLMTFDVSEDLSMTIQPKVDFVQTHTERPLGLQCTITLQNPTPHPIKHWLD